MILGSEVKPSPSEVVMEHYGVLGMKWGVRREKQPDGSYKRVSKRESSTKKELTKEEKKARAKKVAIGTAAIAVAAGAAYAGYKISQNGDISMGSLRGAKSTVQSGKKAAETIASEPTSVIHASRGKNAGFTFLKEGGVPSPLQEYEAGFGSDTGGKELLKRYGNNKIAARFLDPESRKDRATRPIFHEVIIPSSMSDEINSVDDVKSKIWPLIKDSYEAYYNK